MTIRPRLAESALPNRKNCVMATLVDVTDELQKYLDSLAMFLNREGKEKPIQGRSRCDCNIGVVDSHQSRANNPPLHAAGSSNCSCGMNSSGDRNINCPSKRTG